MVPFADLYSVNLERIDSVQHCNKLTRIPSPFTSHTIKLDSEVANSQNREFKSSKNPTSSRPTHLNEPHQFYTSHNKRQILSTLHILT